MHYHPKVGRYFLLGFILVAAIILADQYTKWLVIESTLRLTGPSDGGFLKWFVTQKKIEFFLMERENFRVVTLSPFLNFIMVWNQGISFGMLGSNSPNMQLLLIALPLLISLLMVIWLALVQRIVVSCAIGMIVGGALANVMDRVRFGAVADFIDVHIGAYHWPAFNLADSCIVIGAGILMLDSLFHKDGKQVKK